MSTNPRQQRHFKKKIVGYIFLLGILGFITFFLNVFIISKKPLFISPMGRTDINKVSIEKTLRDNGILFSEVVSSECCYVFNIQNNGQIKLSRAKDIHEQIASLQRILRELTIEGKSFKSIDFRFLGPIISF